MKKGILIVAYILFGSFLTLGVFSASWLHYKYGSSELTLKTEKVMIDIYDLPDNVKPKPHKVYYKKVNITTSIKAGAFPRVITEITTDTMRTKEGEIQIFSDEIR